MWTLKLMYDTNSSGEIWVPQSAGFVASDSREFRV